MSAPLIVSIPHGLGREEATRRLKAGLTRAAAVRFPERSRHAHFLSPRRQMTLNGLQRLSEKPLG